MSTKDTIDFGRWSNEAESSPQSLEINASPFKPVLAVVAGSGQVARNAVEAGADVLLALNAGTYRNFGDGSLASYLPFGSANRQTRELLKQHILPAARTAKVVAGILAGDAEEPVPDLLSEYRKLGVHGITNWPAAGLLDGSLRSHLEACGCGAEAELEMLLLARRLGLETYGFVFDTEETLRFAEAGVENLILHIALTRQPDDVRQGRDHLQLPIPKVNGMLEAVRKSRRVPRCLAFGGMVTEPDDLDQLLRYCRLDGFAGGSVFDRLPV